jgi:hypothetical protein
MAGTTGCCSSCHRSSPTTTTDVEPTSYAVIIMTIKEMKIISKLM